jgi:serine/threonine protein kinase
VYLARPILGYRRRDSDRKRALRLSSRSASWQRGNGAVFLAHDTRLGRNVALKLLAPELAEDERFRRRFLRESRLAAAIDHPNIVPIYQAGEEDGTLFIAMRYVEGTDLRTLLKQQDESLEPIRAASLLDQLADALDAAHAHGLVHSSTTR